jgi:hypothetical protein
MANDPQEFIRIESSIADKIYATFEASVAGLADEIAHKCKAGDWAAAYALANSLDLRGLIADHREEFDGMAWRANLFGVKEATPFATGRVAIPPQALNAIDHLVHMIEVNAADMIRDELTATIQEAEREAKDKLHAVSKADLERLYERWNETRNDYAPRLRRYIDWRGDAPSNRGTPALQDVAFA